MWIQKNLDISWRDIFHGMMKCFTAGGDNTRKISSLWPPPKRPFICLSVRTGFDLFLRALKLPPQSEIIVSALTIPDMLKIIDHHQLIAVPVDIDDDMRPHADEILRLINEKTRAILVAHLFGSRMKMDEILEIAARHKLLVIEDCAQAFDGFGYCGHAEADLSMFSFGTIKTATALGGAVLMVKDASISAAMESLHDQYAPQKQYKFFLKLIKVAAMKIIAQRCIFGFAVRLCRLLKIEYDDFIHKLSRGFPGDNLLEQIRLKSCIALTSLLYRKLSTYSENNFSIRRAKGRALCNLLRKSNLHIPAVSCADHNFWVFPVLTDKRDALIARLRKAGFDAAKRHSMVVVEGHSGAEGRQSPNARKIMNRIVYLPLYRELPDKEIKRMASVVKDIVENSEAGAIAV